MAVEIGKDDPWAFWGLPEVLQVHAVMPVHTWAIAFNALYAQDVLLSDGLAPETYRGDTLGGKDAAQ